MTTRLPRSSAIPSSRWTTSRSTSSRARCRSCSPTASTPPSGPTTRRSSGRPPATGTSSPRSPRRACSAELLERGYEYLFLSNSDNLGATLEPKILGWLAAEGLPFVSEVVDRTESDRKGGHLARRRSDGGLLLRETAQVPDDDQAAFEDIERPPLLQRQQHLGEPPSARREAPRGRRRARAADDRQPQDGRPDGPVLARGRPARDGDGGGHRRLRGRRRRARAARPLRPRQEDERPARGALGRLRPQRRLDACGSSPSASGRRLTSSSTPTTTS